MASNVAKALENEALAQDITFKYNGVTYTVPPMMDWDHDALLYVEQNKIATLVETVLTADEYAKFKATKPKMRDTIALAEELLSAAGTSVEKSEG